MRFPPFKTYVDTQVPWLPKAPKHWDISKPKYYLRVVGSGSETKSNVYQTPEPDTYPAFSASGQDVWMDQWAYNQKALILSAVGARSGKTFIANGKWNVVANTQVIFLNYNADQKYFWYLTNNPDWWEKGGAAQPYVLTASTLQRKWAFPPIEEQQKIAQFLDYQTTKIDRLIEKQQRLIELLEEKRKRVISEGVTRGLDSKVSLKGTGLTWISELPSQWKLLPLKRVVLLLTSGPRGWGDLYNEDGAVFLQSGNLLGDMTVDFSRINRISLPSGSEASRAKVSKGDVLLCITGAKTGNVGYISQLPEETYLNQHLALLRPDPDKIDGEFLGFFLFSSIGQYQLNLEQYGLKKGLSFEGIINLLVPVPPIFEQIRIVENIKEQLANLESLGKKLKEQVGLLEEHRQALVSSAVTGKIDVRDWEPPVTEPEESDPAEALNG